MTSTESFQTQHAAGLVRAMPAKDIEAVRNGKR